MQGAVAVGSDSAPPVKYSTVKNVRPLPESGRGVLWHRIQDMMKVANSADMGQVAGRMLAFDQLTVRQVYATKLYAEVIGRYDKYHRDSDLHRSAVSPAYQRASRGKDDEIERLQRDKSIKAYERKAKRAKKAYLKLDGCIPNAVARTALDDVCLFEREINSAHWPDLRRLLDKIADKFQFGWVHD